MTIPWPEINSTSTLVFGGLTVLVGWLSYRAGLRSHDSQVRIETLSLMNTTQLILDQVAGEREGLFKWFQSLYAAQGRLHSGAMDVKRREFDGFAETIEGLKGELAEAVGAERLSGRKLEAMLIKVRSIHERASGIRDKFATYETRLREDAARHQAQAQEAFRTPPKGR